MTTKQAPTPRRPRAARPPPARRVELGIAAPADRIERCIAFLRGEKVMLDVDLAVLCGVDTRTLNQAVRRNRDRFPADFVFRLTPDEFTGLRSQFVISNRGGRRHRPFAFTEHGVAMLSSVLHSRLKVVFDAIRKLMAPPDKPTRSIGFRSQD